MIEARRAPEAVDEPTSEQEDFRSRIDQEVNCSTTDPASDMWMSSYCFDIVLTIDTLFRLQSLSARLEERQTHSK